MTENPSVYDEQDYQNFLNRCFEISESKKKVKDKRKNKLKERIQNMIAEYDKKGIDLNEEEIVEAIKNQILHEKIDSGGKE